MKIYLAGGVTGNLNALWKEIMKVYLAGMQGNTGWGKTISNEMNIHLAGTTGGSAKHAINTAMEIYLAGVQGKAKDFVLKKDEYKPYILESFFYLRKQHEWITKIRPFFKEFLLDSGAFTYMNGLKDKVNWDSYITEYAEFINRHDIKLFIELDIDSVVGLKEVERLRDKLEELTQRKCIPVWHKSRGLEKWKQITKDYDYVAIGGLVTKEIKGNEYDIFYPLLKIAKENNCKVHGLGFTNMEGMKKYKFYSVDSTAWLYGNRGGFIYNFNGSGMDKIQPKGLRLKGREAAVHNFNEWLKFAYYAEHKL